MYVIRPHSLERTGWFKPETRGLTISERDSQCVMTVPADGIPVQLGDWLLEDRDPGSGVIWRVKKIDTSFDGQTATITAEHIVRTLRDSLMFDEVTPAMMGGSATSVGAREAILYALNAQATRDWTLGLFDYGSVSAGYTFNGDSVYDAIETVSTTLDECFWSYDLTAYPFRIHIRRRGQDAESEMRASRNIKTITRTVDASRMYTRIYPIGKENLHITGNYLSKNEATYGTIMHVQTENGIGDAAMLRTWAQSLLDKHCEPSVTITISGQDLSAATGEALDRIRVGQICQVPLPEFGTVIREIVTKIQWKDCERDAESVTVTLANNEQDLATIIRENEKSGGRGGRAAAKQAEEDHAWFVDTTDHVGMVAESIIGRDPTTGDVNWSRVAEIIVDGTGIHQSVTEAQGELVRHASRIEQTEKGILQEVTDRTNADDGLRGSIEVQANRISLVVEGTGANAQVKRAAIVAAINNGTSSVRISADQIDIDGVVSRLDGKNVNVESLTANSINVESLRELQAGGNMIMYELEDFWSTSGEWLATAVVDASLSLDGKTLTLKKNNGEIINFKKAAAVFGNWSGGKYSVRPEDETTPVLTTQLTGLNPFGSPSINPLGIVTQDFKVLAVNNGIGPPEETGAILSGDVTLAYNDGHDDGYSEGWADAIDDIDWPVTSQNPGSSMTVTVHPTYGGTAVPYTYDLDVQDNDAYIRRNNLPMAKVTHNKYNSGWKAAAGRMSWPGASDQTTTATFTAPSKTTPGSDEPARAYTLRFDSASYSQNSKVILTNANSGSLVTVAALPVGGVYTAGYDAGWSGAVDAITWPTNQTSSGSMTVHVKPTPTATSTTDYTYELVVNKANVQIVRNNVPMAQASNPYGTVTVNEHGWTGSMYKVKATQGGSGGTVVEYSGQVTGTSVGAVTLDESNEKYIDAVINVLAKETGESGTGSTVMSSTKSINAGAVWQKGWEAYYDSSLWTPTGNITYGTEVKIPNKAGGGSKTWFTVPADRYNSGWQAYYDSGYWDSDGRTYGSVIKIPKRDGSGAQEWFTVPSDGWLDYYDSGYWDDGGKTYGSVIKIPKRDRSGSEIWFTVPRDNKLTGWNLAADYISVSLPKIYGPKKDNYGISEVIKTLTSNTNARGGLSQRNNASGSYYFEAFYYDPAQGKYTSMGTRYWYSATQSASLTTMYT